MKDKLIECVPNFSEGNNPDIIKQITNEIEAVENVSLLDVDPGKATNRTVVTLVGTPEQVCEAAFRAVKKASEIIDMSKHKGEHPRFGATDVCPLVQARTTVSWKPQRIADSCQRNSIANAAYRIKKVP